MNDAEYTSSNMPKAIRRKKDISSLVAKRRANALPLSRSPFESGSDLVVSDPDDVLKGLEPGELRVKAPKDVPWTGNALTTRIIERTAYIFHMRSSLGNCHDHCIFQFNVNAIATLYLLP